MTSSKRRPAARGSAGARSSAGASRSSRPASSSRRGGSSRPAASSQGGAAQVPVDSPLRTAVAERSRGLVVWLARLPQFLVPALMVALLLVGLLAPLPIAIVALLVIIAFISWLAFLSWPVLAPAQRGMRVVAIAILALTLVGRLGGWL